VWTRSGHGREVGTPSTPRARRWPPLTVTHEALLVDGSDEAFRTLVQDLLVMANQLLRLRNALARGLGVSEPQYRLFLAIAQLQGKQGVSVGRVARHLRVTGAFVTMETRELVRRGYVEKRADAADGRAVLLALTRAGRRAFERFAAAPRAINDALFRGIAAAEFRTLAALARRLVANGERALEISETLAQPRSSFRRKPESIAGRYRTSKMDPRFRGGDEKSGT
jgi:MarR family transcriptional regulator, organic hydroperoxide resistance regulator